MISIISACRNEAAHIRPLLDSLLAQQPAGEDWEALIADGASEDGTRAIVEEYARRHPARIRLIDNPGRFVSPGLNAAIAAAQGEIVLRMDAHTVYAPDYVRTCVRLLKETGADNVGGPARTRARGWMHEAIAAAYHSRFSSGGAHFHREDFAGWVDTVTYGCWRKETLERLGLFDEQMVRNQDDELNLRLIRSGGRIWQSPEIVSWYTPRSSLSRLFAQYFQYGLWKVAVLKKHRIPARWTHLVPGSFVLSQFLFPLFTLGLYMTGAANGARWTLLGWGAMNLLYLSGVLAASVITASRRGWKLLPALLAIFPTYHISYGLGFLWGLVQFGLRNRQGNRPGGFATQLTR